MVIDKFVLVFCVLVCCCVSLNITEETGLTVFKNLIRSKRQTSRATNTKWSGKKIPKSAHAKPCTAAEAVQSGIDLYDTGKDIYSDLKKLKSKFKFFKSSNVTKCYFCTATPACNDPIDEDEVEILECNNNRYDQTHLINTHAISNPEYGCYKVVVKAHEDIIVTARGCIIKGAQTILVNNIVAISTCNEDLCNSGYRLKIYHLLWITTSLLLTLSHFGPLSFL